MTQWVGFFYKNVSVPTVEVPRRPNSTALSPPVAVEIPSGDPLSGPIFTRLQAFHGNVPLSSLITLCTSLLVAHYTGQLVNPDTGLVCSTHESALEALGVEIAKLGFKGESPFVERDETSFINLGHAYLNALLFFNGDKTATSPFEQFCQVVLAGKDTLHHGKPLTPGARIGLSWQFAFMGDTHIERGSKRVLFDHPESMWGYLDQIGSSGITGWSTHGKGLGLDGKGTGFRYDAPIGMDGRSPYGLETTLVIPSFSSEVDRKKVENKLISLVFERDLDNNGKSTAIYPTTEGEQHAKELALGMLSFNTLWRELNRVELGKQAVNIWNNLHSKATNKHPLTSNPSGAVALSGVSLSDVSIPTDGLTTSQQSQIRKILEKFFTPSHHVRHFHAMLELARTMPEIEVHLLIKGELVGMERSDHANIHNSLLGQMTKPSSDRHIEPTLHRAFQTEHGKRTRGPQLKEHMSDLRFSGKPSKFIQALSEELKIEALNAKALFKDLVGLGAIRKVSGGYESSPTFLPHEPAVAERLNALLNTWCPSNISQSYESGNEIHLQLESLQTFLSKTSFYPRMFELAKASNDPDLKMGHKVRFKFHGINLFKARFREPALKDRSGRVLAASDVVNRLITDARPKHDIRLGLNEKPVDITDPNIKALVVGKEAHAKASRAFEGREPWVFIRRGTSESDA
jgi:hypothetical protein